MRRRCSVTTQANDLLHDEYIDEVILYDPKDVGYALSAVAQRILDGDSGFALSDAYPVLGSPTVDAERHDITFDRMLHVTEGIPRWD